MLNQADGHPAVAFRPAVGEAHSAMLPNGTVVGLVRREGEHLRVVTRDGQNGYIKVRNAKLVVQKPAAKQAAPAVQKPAAPVVQKQQPQQQQQAKAAVAVATIAPRPVAAVSEVCSFTVNGKPYTINIKTANITASLSVHDWIAANVPNSGARRSCGVGRCGSCVAMLTFNNGTLGKTTSRSFNTCLRPILSCNGMAITTGTGIGTTEKPHAVQTALADNSGTQCGFCSVGMVMNLYSRLADTAEPFTAEQLDKMVDANYCRCTGYRPILQTYKTFAGKQTSAPRPTVPTTTGNLVGADNTGTMWTEVTTEAELVKTLGDLQTQGKKDYFLVAGHTSKGLWPERLPSARVSIGGVATLLKCGVESGGVRIGASASITDVLSLLEYVAKHNSENETHAIREIVRHGHLSPGGNIRNMGTVGGNVMLAYEHQANPFPTEWPMMLEAAGATVTFVRGGVAKTVPIASLYAEDLSYSYLQSFLLPFSTPTQTFATYRTAQRHIYSEAFAAAMMGADVENGVIKSIVMVFNGIGKLPTRVAAVESGLVGASVSDEARFQAAATQLSQTLTPIGSHGDVDFRKRLCVSYFYKFFLSLQPSLPSNLESGKRSWLEKGLTSGKQSFLQDASVYVFVCVYFYFWYRFLLTLVFLSPRTVWDPPLTWQS